MLMYYISFPTTRVDLLPVLANILHLYITFCLTAVGSVNSCYINSCYVNSCYVNSSCLQGYKPKYVLLSNSLTHKCKAVELLDSDGSKSSLEVIRLTDVWSVQDKPSRTKYAFEVWHVMLVHVVA